MAPVWITHEHEPRGAGEPRCDAFATWGFETGFRDAWPPDVPAGTMRGLWLVLALRTRGPGWLHARAATALPEAWLVVPGHYATAPAWLQRARFGTAIASLDFIRYLIDPGDARLPAVTPAQAEALAEVRREIEAFEISLTGAGEFDEPPAQPASAEQDVVPPSCVVAVIDDGLPFAHHRFCWLDEGGRRRTRFLALWDQSSQAKPGPDWCLGQVLERKEMDAAMLAATWQGRVDEDAAYHLADVAHLLRHRVTHGAHVLDLASGATPPNSSTALPAIVGVQLRPMHSTLNLSPGAHLLDAFHFALERADAACGGQPGCKVVVNASVGDIAGPHDGTSLFERAVDELVQLRRKDAPDAPLEVVLPEGNAYLSRCHAWSEMEPKTALVLAWHLKPDDGTSSYLEIWLRPKGYKRNAAPVDLDITITLRPPVPSWPAVAVRRVRHRGQSGPGSIDAVLQDAGETIAVLSLQPQPANGRHWMGLVTVAPTAPYGPWTRCAPAGAWTLVVEVGAASATVYCNVYSQRDDKSFGFRGRGRQAVLEDGYDRRFNRRGRLEKEDGDTFRRRAGTINSLANGEEPHVVGGLRRLPGGALEPAPYSSVAIPTRRQRGPKLTLALTEDSPVLHGVLAAGSRSGSVVALSGTSMAAPQRARELAAPSGTGSMRLEVEDAVGISRAVVPQAADLDRRSRRRRG